MRMNLKFIWFVLGLGYKLQVVASLSITEILVLVTAPILFFKDLKFMQRDGIMPYFILSVFVIIGCIIGSIANYTESAFVLRGLSVTCLVSCSIIVSHWLLRHDPEGFKWFVLGLPVSAIISTFYFKSSVEMAMLGESSEEIMAGPLFWISRLVPFILAPTKGWYLHVPGVVNIVAPLVASVFAMLSSVSGRSAALGSLAFAAMVIVGGKTQRRMRWISRHFWLLMVGGVFFVMVAYFSYKCVAANGYLGEEATKKYEKQTKWGTGGIGRLILGGRGDSFIGLLACRDKPIIGWGPWPKDKNGYTEEFITRFGTYDDVVDYQQACIVLARYGIMERRLGCHSHITEFWAWYGIFGLIFILYSSFIILRYLKQDVAAVPQWFAWLACSVPGMFWAILFSPFAERFAFPLFVVACLMARAVRKGSFVLPGKMIKEIRGG